jgi:primosomal protein N' (replication factor Y) (superfamily II helicase)
MFIQVKLLNGFQESLIYKIPASWPIEQLVGSLVKVPLQKRTESALIQQVLPTLPADITFKIREAISLEQFPSDAHFSAYTQQLSSYYALEPLYFFKRIRHFLSEKEQELDIDQTNQAASQQNITLTSEQQSIVDDLIPVINSPRYYPTLIHGVTGSGKTEIYKQLIQETLKTQKTVLLLLPEVSLAVQFTKLLKSQLGLEIPIYGFHSAVSAKEKRALWTSLMHQKPVVIIGVHLPVIMPIAQLGLIIIDEEHDIGYQEKKHPKINTREAALMRAQLAHIPIILGSATPSIHSLYCVEKRNWKFFQLKNRFAGAFPKIKLVKLTEEYKRKNFWISRPLEQAIADRLTKKEQIIIFLNRRGFSFFIQCKSCGHIESCPACSVSLTVHHNQELKCHYCNFSKKIIITCPVCKAGEDQLLKKGIGTQQIVTILEKLFPHARIARADLDATVNKKKWQEIIHNFEEKKIDILVGTQTITKGYHFPGVTLVGILWADINLSFPVYNAAESTLQQLIQVAGRAGRQTAESEVIVQTMINHYIYDYLNEVNYTQFYKHELKHRAEVAYPPIIRFAEIELKHSDPVLLDQESNDIIQNLELIAEKNQLNITILGPAQPPVHKIQHMHARKIYIKSPDISQILKAYNHIIIKNYTSFLYFTPNPLQ